MSDEKPSHLERLSVAQNTSNLALDPNRHKTDADYILGMGLAASRSPACAAPLTHLTGASTQTEFKAAQEAVRKAVKHLNYVRNWRLSGINSNRVADLALAHHISPACPHCSGLRWQTIPGTPSLSGAPCGHCHGTGRRPIQRKFHDEIQDAIDYIVGVGITTERALARVMR